MSIKRAKIVGLATALVVALFLLLPAPVPDPVWRGKPLSQWLSETYKRGWTVRFESTAAVQAMGVDAFPRLRRELRARDSVPKLKLIEFARKHRVRVAHVPARLRCQTAATLCGALGPRSAPLLPELTALTRGGDLQVRIAAIQALGAIGTPAFGTLTNLASDPVPLIRYFTLDALAQLGRPGWTALSNALSDPVPMNRMLALRHLSKAGPDVAIRCLSDPDWNVRRSAASQLGNVGARAESAKPALVQALRDSSFDVRFQAAESLRQIDPQWTSEALQQIIAEAKRLVMNPRTAPDLRRNTAILLHRLDALDDVSLLRDALLGDNQRLLGLHVEALYVTNGPAPLQVLTRLLAYEPDYRVRIAAAEALGKMGPGAAAACDALELRLHEEWPFVRASAIKALGEIAAPADKVIPLLRRGLTDESLQVQVEAAAALWALGAADAGQLRPVLERAATHKLARVRERAAEVLEQMNAQTALKPRIDTE